MPWRPTSLKPVGRRLFKGDLSSWLDQRFQALAEDRLRYLFEQDELVTSAVAWRVLADATALEPLCLGKAACGLMTHDRDTGADLALVVAIPFTGDPELFSLGSSSMRSRRPLTGLVQDGHLTLELGCRSEQRLIAELALTSDISLLHEQLAEQAFALRVAAGTLKRRCQDHVRGSWTRHLARQSEYRRDAAFEEMLSELHALRMTAIFDGLSGMASIPEEP